MQPSKTQNMAGTKVQTSKVWKFPIYPDLARFSGESGSKTPEKKMMMIAFITIKSSLVPLIEGLCAQINVIFSFETWWLEPIFQIFFWIGTTNEPGSFFVPASQQYFV